MKPWKKLCFIGIVSMFIGSAATPAYALPAYEVETFYYTDPGRQNDVGYRILLCSGSTYTSGRSGRYTVRYRTPCRNTVGPAYINCTVNGNPTICPANICNSQDLFICQ